MSELEHLISQLRSGDAGARAAAAERLAQMGEDAQGAAVALVETCKLEDEDAHEWIVAALEGLGPPAAGDMRQLAALVATNSNDADYWAVTLLGRLKEEAAETVPEIAAALANSDSLATRQRAAWALAQIGPAAAGARGALEEAAGGGDPRLAKLAREALDQLPR